MEGRREKEEIKDRLALLGSEGRRVMLALVYQVPLGSEGRKVMLALKVYQALLGNEGRRAFKVLVVLLVPVVVE